MLTMMVSERETSEVHLSVCVDDEAVDSKLLIMQPSGYLQLTMTHRRLHYMHPHASLRLHKTNKKIKIMFFTLASLVVKLFYITN